MTQPKRSLIPKVLVSCPTSDRHKHLLKDWINHLDSFTYKYFDVLLVDTTQDDGSYFKLLKKQVVHDKPVKVIRMKWDSKDHILRHLAYCRERIRKEFLKGGYDFLFFLDSDIFLKSSQNPLQRLMAHFKDNVGLCVPIYHKPYQRPCVLKSGDIVISRGVDLYSFDEINSYRSFVTRYLDKKLTDSEKNLVPFIIKDLTKPYLLRCYATGIGCCLIRRNVLEKTLFRTSPTFLWGEDFWYFNEANDKHFEFWCDLSPEMEADHRNVNWNMILEKSKGNVNLNLAFGPVDATKAQFIHEVPEEEYVETQTKVLVLDKDYKNEKKNNQPSNLGL